MARARTPAASTAGKPQRKPSGRSRGKPAAPAAPAQEASGRKPLPPHCARVGLVLQGGGALGTALSIDVPTLHNRRNLVADIVGRVLYDITQVSGFKNLDIKLGFRPGKREPCSDRTEVWISSADFARYDGDMTPGGATCPEYIEFHDADDEGKPPHFGWTTEFSEDFWTRRPSEDRAGKGGKRLVPSFMCYPEFFDRDLLSLSFALTHPTVSASSLGEDGAQRLPAEILDKRYGSTIYEMATRRDRYLFGQGFLIESLFPYMHRKYEELCSYDEDGDRRFSKLVHVSVGVRNSRGAATQLQPGSPGRMQNCLGGFISIMIRAPDGAECEIDPRYIRLGRLREALYKSLTEELQAQADLANAQQKHAQELLKHSYEPLIDMAVKIADAQSAAVKVRQVLFAPSHAIFQYASTAGELFERGRSPKEFKGYALLFEPLHLSETAKLGEHTDDAGRLKAIVHKVIIDIFGLPVNPAVLAASTPAQFVKETMPIIREMDKYGLQAMFGAQDRVKALNRYKLFLGVDKIANGTALWDDYKATYSSLKRCLHAQYKDFATSGRVTTPLGLIALENVDGLVVDGAMIKTDRDLHRMVTVLFPKLGVFSPFPAMKFVSSFVADVVHFAYTNRNATLSRVAVTDKGNTVSFTFNKKVFSLVSSGPGTSQRGDPPLDVLIKEEIVEGRKNLRRFGAYQGDFLGPLIALGAACAIDTVVFTVEPVGQSICWRITRTAETKGTYVFEIGFEESGFRLSSTNRT